jgi:dTMP kinase
MIYVFEGVDGSGKTTIAALFAAHLRTLDQTVLELRDPGSTHDAYILRETIKAIDNPFIRMTLFELARAELIEHRIKPAVDRGDTIILDRFYYSNMIYFPQYNAERRYIQTAIQWAKPVNQYAAENFSQTAIVLDIPYEAHRSRLIARGEEPLPALEFHRIRTAYSRVGWVVDGTCSPKEILKKLIQRFGADYTQGHV